MPSILCSGERALTTRSRRVHWAALLSLLVFSASSSGAQTTTRQVLILQSFDRGILVLDYMTANLRVDLDQAIGQPVNVVQIVVSPTGRIGAPEQKVVAYLQATYAARPKPDLIVTFAGPASVFARQHRQQLFPDTPLLFAAVDQRFLRDAPIGENEVAVAVDNNVPQLVDEILHLLPDTRQIFMIMGSGQIGSFWQRELEKELKRFHDRLTFIWSGNLSFPEIMSRCAKLPSHSAIMYFTFGTDAAAGTYADERVLAELRATANAPMFGLNSVLLGKGIVGGTLMSNEQSSRAVADAATRLLNGATPASVSVPVQRPGPPLFDWRELQRWGIPESRLPPGSTVRYRAPSLWQAYRTVMLSAAGVLAVQTLLIAGLLYQRRERQRAEIESRRNLALAADASRRQTMSALTSSIAHELGQPLSSMLYNTHALQTMITGKQATQDTIGEILSDIYAQGLRATQIIERNRTMLRSHSLDKKPIDLEGVIDESLSLVAHDMEARQVRAVIILSSSPCVINGDQVLLQQVLVNLLVNAMDAMAGTPASERLLTIRSDVRAAEVDIAVRDNGMGLAPEIVDRLFSPFMTTKSLGLGIGLTIVRTILDAHNGTVAAHNNPEGGATFVVTLPRTDAAAE